MFQRRKAAAALAALALCLPSCGGGAPGTSAAATAPQSMVAKTPVATATAPELSELVAASCASRAKKSLVPEDERRDGSAVALARTGAGRLLALVADHDRQSLDLVDVETATLLSSAAVLGSPEQIVVLGDGRVALTVSDRRHLEVFDFEDGDTTPTLTRVCARATPAGPFGVALAEDGTQLVVASAWDPALTVFDPKDMSERGRAALPRAPRGVVIEDGRAFVSHLSGARLSSVALDGELRVENIDLSLEVGSMGLAVKDAGFRRGGSQGYALAAVTVSSGASSKETDAPLRGDAPKQRGRAGKSKRIVAPMVSVDPGSPERATIHYYGPPPTQGVGKQAAVAVTVDPAARAPLTTHVIATTAEVPAGQCLLPRAVAFQAESERLYIACLGLDELLELDARAADPMRAIRARYTVPKGPLGVATSARAGVAVVLGQFESTLAIVPLDKAPPRRVVLGSSPVDPVAAVGRELFYRTGDLRITEEGLGCASCHPDGGEDGLSWSTPEGLRQTPMLAGRLGDTAPYGWTRQQMTLSDYIADTCNRLGGQGMANGELDALASYVRNLPSPPRDRGDAQALAVEGREVFSDRGCDTCHLMGVGTDGRSYAFDGDTYARSYDTPSLRHISLTGPYFHDGRYGSLAALLSDSQSRMGLTSKLSAHEIDALGAYLETL